MQNFSPELLILLQVCLSKKFLNTSVCKTVYPLQLCIRKLFLGALVYLQLMNLRGAWFWGHFEQFQWVGETGVYRDTGSKGTVGGKIVDINKIKTILVCYFNTYILLWHEIWLSFVNNCMSYWQNKKNGFFLEIFVSAILCL